MAERQASAGIERAAARSERLQRLTARLAAALSRDQILAATLNEYVDVLAVRAAGIMVPTADGQHLEVGISHGFPADVVERFRRVAVDAPFVLSEAYRERRAIYLDATSAAVARYPTLSSVAQPIGAGAWAAVPLVAGGRVLGVLTLALADARELAREDRDFLETIASQYAQALDRADLFERERRARSEAELLADNAQRARIDAEGAQRRLRDLFLAAPALIAVTRGPDHVIEIANGPFLALLGRVDPRSVIGKPVGEAFPALIPAGYVALADRVYRSGEAFIDPEMPARGDSDGDGKVDRRWTNVVIQPYRDDSGRVAGLLFHGVDVTEQVRTAQELRASNQMLGAIVTGVPLAVMGLDRQGRVTLWNPGAERIFGWTAAEVLGQILPSIPPVYESEFERHLRTVFEGTTFSGVETQRLRKDGTLVDVAIYTAPIRDSAGTIVSNISVVADISERKRDERDQAFLAEASRLLANSLDEGEIVNALAHLAVPTLGDWCLIDLLDESGELRRVAIACADPATEPLTREYLANYPPKRDETDGVATVIRTGQSAHASDIGDDQIRQLSRDPREYEILRTLGWRATLSIPLIVRDRVLGALTVISASPDRCYSGRDVAVVEDLGRRVALALENARLFARVVRSEQDQRHLAELSRDLAAARMDRSEILGVVCRAAAAMIGEHASIHLVDSDGRTLTLAAIQDPDLRRRAERERILDNHPLQVGAGWTGGVAATGEPIFLPSVDPDELRARTTPEHREYIAKIFTQGIMIVPMRSHGRVLGTVTVGRSAPGPRYRRTDLTQLQEIADRAAVALENTYLYEAEQRSRVEAEEAARRTARLQTVTLELATALTVEEVARVLVDQALAALGGRAGSVALLDTANQVIDVIRAVGHPPDAVERYRQLPIDAEFPLSDCIRTGEALFVRSAAERRARYPQLDDLLGQSGDGAIAVVPLTLNRHVFGGLGISFPERHDFSADEQELLQSIARQCAQAFERARLYEAEKRARAEAEAAVKIRDEFLSVAAHELKTPLTGLRAGVQLLLRIMAKGLPLDAEALKRRLAMIEAQSTKLTLLINQLLDVSRLDSGRLLLDRAEVDLLAIVEGAAGLAQARTEAHTIRVHGDRVVARLDPLRIEQVVTNLLDNAIKYSPKGGLILVEVGPATTDHVTIGVTDQGIGIPIEHRRHIFDRYYQAHAHAHLSGLGLGLYISRQIVDLHGGKIDVAFPPAGGTRFEVSLPIRSPT